MKLSKAGFGTAFIALTLGVVQAALAADKQPVKLNAADQAAAKAITLKASDLGAGWKGGATKPDLSNDTCPTKRSDLVLTGAAKSEFTTDGALISSESNVLRTAAMVRADWNRTVGSSTWMACARRALMQEDGAKVVSFKKVTFPALARYSVRYRVVVDYGKPGSPTLVVIDLIFLGQGRSEISLMIGAPHANRTEADGAGRRLAKILLGRVAA